MHAETTVISMRGLGKLRSNQH